MRKDQTMKRKRHTEEQIIAILKEHEAGVKTADLCRKLGISEASFYNWGPSTAGSEAKRLLVPHRATMVTATAACPPAQARTVRE